MTAFLDAHGLAVHVIASAVVLASFTFVAGLWAWDRLSNVWRGRS